MAETYTQTAGGYFRNSDGAGPYYKDEDGAYKLLGGGSSSGGAEVTDERIMQAELVGYESTDDDSDILPTDTIPKALAKNRHVIDTLKNTHAQFINDFTVENEATIKSLTDRLDALEAKE